MNMCNRQFSGATVASVDERNPANHQECKKNLVNIGIFNIHYQPQLQLVSLPDFWTKNVLVFAGANGNSHLISWFTRPNLKHCWDHFTDPEVVWLTYILP